MRALASNFLSNLEGIVEHIVEYWKSVRFFHLFCRSFLVLCFRRCFVPTESLHTKVRNQSVRRVDANERQHIHKQPANERILQIYVTWKGFEWGVTWKVFRVSLFGFLGVFYWKKMQCNCLSVNFFCWQLQNLKGFVW